MPLLACFQPESDAHLSAALRKSADSGGAAPAVVIVPTQRWAVELRRATAAGEESVAAHRAVLSYSEFRRMLCEETGTAPLPRTEHLLLIEQLLAGGYPELARLGQSGSRDPIPAVAKRIAALLTHPDGARLSLSTSVPRMIREELKRFRAAWHQQLESWDEWPEPLHWERFYAQATSTVVEGAAPGVREFLWYGFDLLDPNVLATVRGLDRLGYGVTIAFACEATPAAHDYPQIASSLRALELKASTSATDSPPSRPGIRVQSAANRVAEAVHVADAVRELVDANSAWCADDIVVVAPETEAYLPLLRRAFAERGLPLREPPVRSLADAPLALLLKEMGTVADSDLRRSSIEAFLLHPACPIAVPSLDRFAALCRKKEADYSLDAAAALLGEDDEAQVLAEAWRLAHQILRTLAEPRAPREHATILRRHILAAGDRALTAWEAEALEDRDAPRHALEQAAELLADQVSLTAACLERAGAVSALPLSAFLAQAADFFAAQSLPAPLAPGIPVVGRLEARGVRPRALFIVGLVEGEFPNFPASGRSLPGLSSLGRTLDEELGQQRYVFDHLMRDASALVVLTYPTHLDGEVVTPSQFVERAVSRFGAIRADTVFAPSRGAAIHLESGLLDEAAPVLLSAWDSATPAELELVENVAWNRAANASRQQEEYVSCFDGWIGQEPVHVALAERLATRVWSPSSLENAMNCRFRFAAERIAGLAAARDEANSEARNLGTILHDIVCRFYTEWLNAKRRVPEEKDRAAAAQLLVRIADEVLALLPDGYLRRTFRYRLLADRTPGTLALPDDANWPQGDLFRLPPGALLHTRHQGILGTFLRREMDLAVLGSRPVLVEYDCGTSADGTADARTIELGDLTLAMRGRIDRIDAHRFDGTYWIIDYKTSASLASGKEMLDGRVPQVALYVLLLRQHPPDALARLDCAGGYLLQLSNVDADPKMTHILTKRSPKGLAGRRIDVEAFESGLAKTATCAAEAVTDLTSGRLFITLRADAESKSSVCEYCGLERLCRKSLLRTQPLIQRWRAGATAVAHE